MKITKKKFLNTYILVILFLAIVKVVVSWLHPFVSSTDQQTATVHIPTSTVKVPSRFFDVDGKPVKNRIYSVHGFSKTFPDQNDVQLISAMKNGVTPVKDRDEAEQRKSGLVYIGSNPFFYVEPLKRSIPYLVPKASVLLQDIGRTFFDSLQVKGVPLHKIIVTSVMRSEDDVTQLRGHNGNATQNSCHLYGTTFDITYNRYQTVEVPGETKRRAVRNDTLKWILSEVLNDMRKNNRCYIKYEVHQGCFHITVK